MFDLVGGSGLFCVQTSRERPDDTTHFFRHGDDLVQVSVDAPPFDAPLDYDSIAPSGRAIDADSFSFDHFTVLDAAARREIVAMGERDADGGDTP